MIVKGFFTLTARVASSGVEKATNPDPLLIPCGSRIICESGKKKHVSSRSRFVHISICERKEEPYLHTLHEVTVPNSENSSLSFSSLTLSSKFLTYKFAP